MSRAPSFLLSIDNQMLSLIKACREGDTAHIKVLVEQQGADINATETCDWRPLIEAARSGHMDVVRYLTERCGVDINATDKDGKTALDHVIMGGDEEMMTYLWSQVSLDIYQNRSCLTWPSCLLLLLALTVGVIFVMGISCGLFLVDTDQAIRKQGKH